jgi:hypothetical protein
MTGWASTSARAGAALALLWATVVVAAPAEAGDHPVPSKVLFSFQGDDVYESSGLVDRGDIVYTNNDSGDAAVVYGIDPHTGRTVSRTTYADKVTDVEAIAPGAAGTIWAGDTGDNRANRDDIAVYRMQPRDGDSPGTRYPLTYPDGPHDAETLLVQPSTQRVFVVSKAVFGGTVYVAPRRLRADRPNRLRAYARVPGLITDGTFFPDGRHVLLRTYGTASVYTFPAFGLVGTVTLPEQQQGEGISVSRTGRVLVSSEGVHEDVLQVRLPKRLTSPHAATEQPGPKPSTRPPPQDNVQTGTGTHRDAKDWGGIALVVVVLAGLAWIVVRGAPPRGRRKQ